MELGKKAVEHGVNVDYLVVGTGRCGSVYMARLLTSLGVTCGHESIFGEHGLGYALELMRTGMHDTSFASRHDTLRNVPEPEWFDARSMRAESSWMAAPFLDHPCLDDAAIIHVVRNPLAVISSFVGDLQFFRGGTGSFDIYRNFALAHTPDVMHLPTEIERTCLHWVQWNELIARKATGKRYMVFNVESKLTDELLAFLDVPASMRDVAFSNTTINSWKRRPGDLTMMDIPDGEIKDRFVAAAAKLGYDLQQPVMAGDPVSESPAPPPRTDPATTDSPSAP